MTHTIEKLMGDFEEWQDIKWKDVLKAKMTKVPIDALFTKGVTIQLTLPEHSYTSSTLTKVVGWNSRKNCYVVQNLRTREYRNVDKERLEASYVPVAAPSNPKPV